MSQDNETQIKLIDFCSEYPPYRLYTEMSKSLYGLDPQLKQIAVLIHTWADRLSSSNPENSGSTLHFMLAGPSGCGKTSIARVLSKIMPVPVHIVNASAFSKVGYSGKSYTDLVSFKDIYDADSCGVIFLDEFDKELVYKSIDSAGIDNNKEAVQELLTALEGEVISTSYGEIDTARILFIATGAFSGIEEYQDAPEEEDGFYFGIRPKTKKERQPITVDDLIRMGASDQVVSRFLTIINLPEPNTKTLYRICADVVSEVSGLLHVSLPTTQTFYDQLLEEASSHGLHSCRTIRSVVWEYALNRFSDQLCQEPYHPSKEEVFDRLYRTPLAHR